MKSKENVAATKTSKINCPFGRVFGSSNDMKVQFLLVSAWAVLALINAQPNELPAGNGSLVFSEVNTNQPGPDVGDYVELRWRPSANLNSSAAYSLDEYLLVLFDGRTVLSYLTISLAGYRTNAEGYFLIGPSHITPKPDIVVRGNFLQNGDQLDNPDAVALYRAPSRRFPNGTIATSVGLVDAVVYSRFAPRGDRRLEMLLVPRVSSQLHEVEENTNGVRVDLAISRCPLDDQQDMFVLSLPTPGEPNNCTAYPDPGIFAGDCPNFSTAMSQTQPGPADTKRGIVISEINSDTPLIDTDEFVELYDGGRGNTSLHGITIVFFDGVSPGNQAYGSIDLSQYSTNPQGYFVIGSASVSPLPDLTICDHFVGNGPDAVALYSTSLVNSSGMHVWSSLSSPTQSGLLDAVVYSRSGVVDRDLVAALVPGQSQLQERVPDMPKANIEVSLSRCSSSLRLTQNAFVISMPTPGVDNNCSLTSQGPTLLNVLLVSELFSSTAGSYVELSDGGIGFTSLSGVYLDVGQNNMLDLSAYNTDRRGFFVIGSSDRADLFTNTLDLSRSSHARNFSIVQNSILLDAILFNLEEDDLPPVESDILYVPSGFSISRCFGRAVNDPAAFVASLSTVGQPNRCSAVRLNEIYIASDDDKFPPSPSFIELFDGGSGTTPLVQYTLLYDNGENSTAIALDSFTTSASGYFSLSAGPVFGSYSILNNDKLVLFPVDGRFVLQRNLGDVNVSVINVRNETSPQGSWSWCSNSSSAGVTIARPTPGLTNDCGRRVEFPESSNILINEIDANQPFGRDRGEFVELYDGGQGNTSLDGLQLVVFQGLPVPTVRAVYTLLGFQTSSSGHFLAGASTCQCNPDFILNQGLLPNRAGGIALFQIPPGWIVAGSSTLPPSGYLVDAVVYNARTRPTRQPQALLNFLMISQQQLQEDQFLSLGRCFSRTPFNQAAFANTSLSPGRANICPPPPTTPKARSTTRLPTGSTSRLHTASASSTLAMDSTRRQSAGPSARSSKPTAYVAGIVVGVLLLLAILVAVIFYYRRRRAPFSKRGEGSRLPRQISSYLYDNAPLPPDDDTIPFSKLAEGINEDDGQPFQEAPHAMAFLQSLHVPVDNTQSMSPST